MSSSSSSRRPWTRAQTKRKREMQEAEVKRVEGLKNSGMGDRRWENLDRDPLLKILQTFNIQEVALGISPVAHICHSWREVFCDSDLWKTLDLTGQLESRLVYVRDTYGQKVRVKDMYQKNNTRILKVAVNLSNENIETLIFHHKFYINDDQLAFTARRCPKLKRFVLPAWNLVTEAGVRRAIWRWPELESLTLFFNRKIIPDPDTLMAEIQKNCPSFSELKISGKCDMDLARLLVTRIPNLKVLSVRCSYVVEEALLYLLDELKELRSLNIAHCYLVHVPPPPAPKVVLDSIENSILQRASRLGKFVMCMSGECVMCQRTRAHEGLVKWDWYDDDLWKVDELQSLAL